MTNAKRPTPITDEQVRRFVELLTAYQTQIRGYILALTANLVDADDIMQETSSVMWSRFADFEPGTDFLAWSLCIARYRVYEYRRRRRRQKTFQLDDAVLEQMEPQARRQDRSHDYIASLRRCAAKLPQRDAHLLGMRYEDNLPVKDIAQRLERSVQSVYQNLARIHELLLACIRRTLLTEERPCP